MTALECFDLNFLSTMTFAGGDGWFKDICDAVSSFLEKLLYVSSRLIFSSGQYCAAVWRARIVMLWPD